MSIRFECGTHGQAIKLQVATMYSFGVSAKYVPVVGCAMCVSDVWFHAQDGDIQVKMLQWCAGVVTGLAIAAVLPQDIQPATVQRAAKRTH